MNDLVRPLTEATFDQEVVGSRQPLLVDFWAQGCGPCAAIAPVLEEIAAEHLDTLSVAEVRLDDAPGLAARFEITTLPTLILFTGGRPARRFTAIGSKGRLLADLAEFLPQAGDSRMTGTEDERVTRFWERYAPRYDRGMRLYDRFLFTGGRSWACSQVAGDVLEVAVGTGLNLPYYPPGTRLTGIDASPAMLAIARRRAAELGIQAQLREADAQALPFPDASFDAVVCTLSLCCIPADEAAISEMHRVLRPGGRLVLLDHVASSNPVVHAGQRLLEQLTLRTTGEYQTRRPLPLVAAAGFAIESQECLRAGIVERVTAVKAH